MSEQQRYPALGKDVQARSAFDFFAG